MFYLELLAKTLTLKNKKCKNCGNEFNPLRPLQYVCGYKCARERQKSLKKSREELRSVEKGIVEKKKLQDDLKITKTICHRYIRLRDKGKKCISCDRDWDDFFQAGHFYKSELYSNLRFDENNIHGQCRYCNIRLEGNINQYTLNLPNRIGVKKFKELNKIAKEREGFKWDRDKLKELRLYYSQKLKELKNEQDT